MLVRQWRLEWREIGLAALAGLCWALAFPLVIAPLAPEPLLDAAPRELLILPAAALLYRLGSHEARRAAGCGFIAGFVGFSIMLYWLDIAMVRYGRMPQWQAVPSLVLLVAWCALHVAALPVLQRLITARTRIGGPLAFTAAVLALEWLRSTLLTGFPSGLWGYAAARGGALLKLATLGGFWILSALIALVAALAVDGWRRRRLRDAVWLAATVGLSLLGAIALPAGGADTGAAPLRVGIVQGNVEQRLKNRDIEYAAEIRRRYLEMSRAVAGSVDQLIWPEAAWPGHVSTESRRLFEPPLGVPLLLGASTRLPGAARVGYNSAFFIDAGGVVQQRYDKRRLVPFGEYVPLRRLLPIDRLAPGLIEYLHGDSAASIGAPPAGVLICYDGVFPEPARDSTLAGASFLVNLTNDGWYGVSSAPYQHRDFYVLRAVETGRWVVRAANTGVSVFIDPDGNLHNPTRLGETAVIAAAVAPRAGTTFFVRWGNWVPALGIGVLLAALIDLAWERSRRLGRERLTAAAPVGNDLIVGDANDGRPR